jgi:hypothetical protein
MATFKKTRQEKDFEQLILSTPAPGKHCGRNALRHIERAWKLAKRDPEMAAFRAITAEEEAASAVFHAIRRRKYSGYEKLKPRDHVQKNALFPFCTAIRMVLAQADIDLNLQTQLLMSVSQKKVWVRFNAEKFGHPGNYLNFVPPLNFSMKDNDLLPHNFSKQLQEIAELSGASSIEKYLKERANKRNRLLYADERGIPNVELKNFLQAQRDHVVMLLGVYLLIDPHPEKQLFAQQAFLAFLKALNQLPKDITFE